MFNRYAVYYAPPPGTFADLGAAWLGWDVHAGKTVPHPEIAGIDIEKVTWAPRKYGLHGTMKAPFFLATDRTEDDLHRALADFCAHQQGFTLDGLELSQIGRFLALTPVGNVASLNKLAADVVRELDPFRAPMKEAEFTRKNTPNLSEQQRAYLTDWGYPHVMEFFRFHITLTGPLEAKSSADIRAAVMKYFGDSIPVPFHVDSLSLCGEDSDGRFQQIARFALGKAADRL